MKGKNTVVIVLLLVLSHKVIAQNLMPAEYLSEKCLVGTFEYDKKFSWKEVDCHKVKGSSKQKTNKQLIKQEQERLKFLKYQEKLKNLGYKININGRLDRKTIKAHNKYLKSKKKL